MTPLDSIANTGLTSKVHLDTLAEVMIALKTQIVFCDLIKGTGIPVRQVRPFKSDQIARDIPATDPLWTERLFLGQAKGFEVLTLEGWNVPERVYYVERKGK